MINKYLLRDKIVLTIVHRSLKLIQIPKPIGKPIGFLGNESIYIYIFNKVLNDKKDKYLPFLGF